MTLLILGVVLWSVVHFVPAGLRGLRGNLIGSMGEGPYKGVVTLLLVASIVLMVFGWRSIEPTAVYKPGEGNNYITLLLMVLSLYLFGAANVPSNAKRFLRHPMLAGMVTWGLAHLASNGDDRSLVLFGGLALWALIMMPFLNRRDGAYDKPEALPVSKDLGLVFIAIVIFVLFVVVHPWIAGVGVYSAGQ